MIPWSDTTKRRLGLVAIAAAMTMAVADIVISFSLGESADVAEMLVLTPAFGVVLVMSVLAVPGNGAVWAMIWAAVFGVASGLGDSVAVARSGITTAEVEQGLVNVAPSDLDTLSAAALAVALSLWLPSVFLLANHLLILFPSGSAGSVRWRWLAWVSALCMGLIVLATLLAVAPWVDRPYDEIYGNVMGAAGWLSNLMLVLMLIALAAIVHLIRRYRRSSGEEKLQYRWVTWALALQVLFIFSFGVVPSPGAEILGTVALALVPLSFGIAMTKYRLYDIDLVISRSLVFLGLAIFITAIYVTLVVGIGSLFSGSELWLSITATALVAIAFEPVRNRLQRWANRLVYGQRATPYEVLSDLTRQMAATETEEGLLDRMALRLADGTGADRAVVWTADGSVFTAVACEPASALPEDHLALEAIPGMVRPIEHDDELLGALSVETRRGEALTPTEIRLIEDLAGSAGLLMQRLRLDAELEEKARELMESRRRLVDAQDVERRRLEGELDQGAQQQAEELEVQVRVAAQRARQEGAEESATMIEQMAEEAQDAVDQIRSLAHGIYPPLLETEGLPAAVASLADRAPSDVHLDATVANRHSLAVEAAIYFCVAEALTNAVKYGTGPLTVAMSDANGELAFEVSDSGPGFDPTTVRRGAGLNNLADRLDALDGTLTIASTPGGHTTIIGRVQVSVPAAV